MDTPIYADSIYAAVLWRVGLGSAVGIPLNAMSLDIMLRSASTESLRPVKRRRLRAKSKWLHGGDGSAAAVEREAVATAAEREKAAVAQGSIFEELSNDEEVRLWLEDLHENSQQASAE